MNQPLISIITPTLNSAHTLEKAIGSVLQQTYNEIEHVFVDGLSSDETVPIIKTFLDRYTYSFLLTEKDNGIYDAMNKGLRVCRGDWIYFMGADDEFYDDYVLTELVSRGLLNQENIVYGNVIIRGDTVWAKNNEVYDGMFDLPKLLRKNICHQGIFYPRSVIEKVGFYSENYPVTADWDYNLRCFAKYQFTFVDRIIAYFQSGGRSTRGDNSKFFNDLPKNILAYFNLDPDDSNLRKKDSPFAPILNRFDELHGGPATTKAEREPDNNTTSRSVSLCPEAISGGISLFTALKNRNEMLEAALKTWITHDTIDEIIILDWG
ncbi:MAG: glycosyltransferase, partial [Alphaproteobacteria bacterium]|nr:glycosyltransferase [Alphaproteobacteria bacterium]